LVVPPLPMGSSSFGYAAGCEAGLRPAVSLSLRKSGYAPRPGSARSGQGRTRGGAPLWIKKLAAGRSPASHPAAEPELEEPMLAVVPPTRGKAAAEPKPAAEPKLEETRGNGVALTRGKAGVIFDWIVVLES
jgi:hypothetical protein